MNENKPEGLKWIFATLIYSPSSSITDPSSLFFLFSFFPFHFHLDFQSSFFNYFFIWRLIFNPFNLLAYPLCRLCGNSSRQSDPFILSLHFSPNNLGLNEGEVVSLLTRLDLHKSSQAGDDIGFSPLLLFYYTSLDSSKGEMFFTDIAWHYSLLRD